MQCSQSASHPGRLIVIIFNWRQLRERGLQVHFDSREALFLLLLLLLLLLLGCFLLVVSFLFCCRRVFLQLKKRAVSAFFGDQSDQD